MIDILAAAQQAGVIPVLTIARLEQAVPLAQALAAGGLCVIEVTMRTPVALDAIAAIATALPQVLVGAGTILGPADLAAAEAAGARFALSPGASAALLAAALSARIPFIPGAATASEVMVARAAGYRLVKLFPAEQLGGPAMVKAIGAPLPDMMVCPTGGIDAAKAPAYRALPNVACVGGSWMAPAAMVEAGDWSAITALARAAAAGA